MFVPNLNDIFFIEVPLRTFYDTYRLILSQYYVFLLAGTLWRNNIPVTLCLNCRLMLWVHFFVTDATDKP